MIPIKELLLQEAIINILNNSSAKLKTRDILNALQDEGEWEEIDKKDINRLLYGPLEKDVRMDNNHRWSMVNGSAAEVTSNDGAVVKKLVGREQHVSDISVKWARTSTNHVFNKEEISIPSFFNVKTTKNNTVITINTKHPASNVLCELLNLQENKETDKEIGIEQASNIIEVLLKAWAYLEINSSDKRKQLLEDIRSDWGLTARDLLDSTEDVGTITVDRTVDNTETSNSDNSTFLEEPSVNISIQEPNSLPSKPQSLKASKPQSLKLKRLNLILLNFYLQVKHWLRSLVVAVCRRLK
jgi:hypothetical protein